jgi:hypothetical protein
VVDIREIQLLPEEIDVRVGGRASVGAMCTLRDGTEADDVSLIWTEDHRDIARANSIGTVFGVSPGKTNVTAGDDRCFAENSASVTVTERDSSGDDPDRPGRGGFPLILVSGDFDPHPATGEPVRLTRDDPPVYQPPEDVDLNIWWINSAAPLAELYLDDTAGHGFEKPSWRMYHVERLIDAIVEIRMSSRSDENLDIDQWSYERGALAAEVQAKIVSDLRDFILTGNLPSSNEEG